MKLKSVAAVFFSPTGTTGKITKSIGETVASQACVKICPVHAKYFDDPVMLSHIRMLEEHYSRRAENEIFL